MADYILPVQVRNAHSTGCSTEAVGSGDWAAAAGTADMVELASWIWPDLGLAKTS